MESTITSITNQQFFLIVCLVTFHAQFTFVTQILKSIDQLSVQRRVTTFGVETTFTVVTVQKIIGTTLFFTILPITLLVHLFSFVNVTIFHLFDGLTSCLLGKQLRMILLSTLLTGVHYLLILRVLEFYSIFTTCTNIAFRFLFLLFLFDLQLLADFISKFGNQIVQIFFFLEPF